jgi:hypothetical protein
MWCLTVIPGTEDDPEFLTDATGTRPAVRNFISHFTIIFKNSSSVEVNINRYEILITIR